MKINNLNINGFGKLEEKEIEFSDGINIVTGKNESGKSTLLNFILAMFFGLSKTKNGKNLSNHEKYTPWGTNNFSGMLEYKLDNNSEYKINRVFSRRAFKLFNEKSEEISSEFEVNKNKESLFFQEQTQIDEELFLKSVCVNQEEVKLEEKEQNILIQKITNLLQTGDDNIEYNKILSNLNTKLLEEIGTNRSQNRPLNLLIQNINALNNKKTELEQYNEEKDEFQKNKNSLIKKIEVLDKKIKLFLKIKNVKEIEKREIEKINIEKEIEEKNNLEMLEIEEQTKTYNKEFIPKKKPKMGIYILILNIILNVIINIIFNKWYYKIISLILIVVNLMVIFIQNNKHKKQIINQKKDNKEKENLLKNKIQEIKEKRIKNLNSLETEKKRVILEKTEEINNILNEFENDININEISDKYEELCMKCEKLQSESNSLQMNLHMVKIREETIAGKLDNLAVIEEELEYNKEQYNNLISLGSSIEYAKQGIEEAYKKIKEQISPVILKNISSMVSRITDGKYRNVRITDKSEMILESKDGNYLELENLSCGTVYQIYLALRMSFIKEITDETLPIILDEPFVYYDNERLKSVFKFLKEEYPNNQIIIFSCSNREIECLQALEIFYNVIDIC